MVIGDSAEWTWTVPVLNDKVLAEQVLLLVMAILLISNIAIGIGNTFLRSAVTLTFRI